MLEIHLILGFKIPFLLALDTLLGGPHDGWIFFPLHEKHPFPLLGHKHKYRNRSFWIGLFTIIYLMANHSVLSY